MSGDTFLQWIWYLKFVYGSNRWARARLAAIKRPFSQPFESYLIRKSENTLGDDIELNFGRTTLDRICFGP